MRWKTKEEKQGVAPQGKSRDSGGRFIRGHTPLGLRDKVTGRFVSEVVFKYDLAVQGVDAL